MSTAESLKKLLDEFNEKENMISEERSAVEVRRTWDGTAARQALERLEVHGL